jgi:transposase
MMLALAPRLRFLLATAATDMRKGFDGLAGIVRNHLGADPTGGDVFVFVNRSRTHIRLLYFDGDGFVMIAKRLERGTFAAPATDASSEHRAALPLGRDQLVLMLEGIDRDQTRRRTRYSRA